MAISGSQDRESAMKTILVTGEAGKVAPCKIIWT
jgi:hypothetical protein